VSAIRTLLADDHTLVRAGIRALLRDIEGVTIVAEADNGRDAVRLASELTPDLAIMDISMKELNGIEATAQMKTQSPGTRVLILSMHTTEDFVRRALKAGAAGYLVKDSAPLELTMAIEAVMRDETYLSPRVSKSLLSGLVGGRASPGGSSLDALTPRQREVLQLVAEGRSTKQIAFALAVSVKTVETHRAALMERLDIRDTASLVVYAVRNGLVSAEGPRDPE
jgi:DNA-binding NarL/FixJ family response regulator